MNPKSWQLLKTEEGRYLKFLYISLFQNQCAPVKMAAFEELLAQNPIKKKKSAFIITACLTCILQCLTPVISPDEEPATHKKDNLVKSVSLPCDK